MEQCLRMPFLSCGEIFENTFLTELKSYEKPIDLALVTVDVGKIKNSQVLINYSQNLEFELLDLNPEIEIKYRLIRKASGRDNVKILESWTYKVAEVIPSEVQPINTIEPLVLNFCDDSDKQLDTSFTYVIQIVEIISENSKFSITNQEISAIVNYGMSMSDYFL